MRPGVTFHPPCIVVGATEVDGLCAVVGEAHIAAPVVPQPRHREVETDGGELERVPGDDDPILIVHRHGMSEVVGATEVDGLLAVTVEALVQRPEGIQPRHSEVESGAGLGGVPGKDDPILAVHRHAVCSLVRTTEVDGLLAVTVEALVQAPKASSRATAKSSPVPDPEV